MTENQLSISSKQTGVVRTISDVVLLACVTVSIACALVVPFIDGVSNYQDDFPQHWTNETTWLILMVASGASIAGIVLSHVVALFVAEKSRRVRRSDVLRYGGDVIVLICFVFVAWSFFTPPEYISGV